MNREAQFSEAWNERRYADQAPCDERVLLDEEYRYWFGSKFERNVQAARHVQSRQRRRSTRLLRQRNSSQIESLQTGNDAIQYGSYYTRPNIIGEGSTRSRRSSASKRKFDDLGALPEPGPQYRHPPPPSFSAPRPSLSRQRQVPLKPVSPEPLNHVPTNMRATQPSSSRSRM
jgi:hypothetical protein